MDIEKKALELVNAVRIERGFPPSDSIEFDNSHWDTAFYRAIEAHEADNARHAAEMEAFKREVSEAVEGRWANICAMGCEDVFARFIIAKPDPLEKALEEAGYAVFPNDLQRVHAAIKKRGGKIVWGEG